MRKKVILLVNTGTPDKPEVKQVRRFLSEFLNDSRIIDLPWVLRKILVNLVIIPFRVRRSARLYRKLWTPNGAPLLLNMENLILKLRIRIGENHTIYGAMRYGNPSLKEVLQKIKNISADEIIIIPLFPQYASSTTGSVNSLILKQISKWNIIPAITFTGQFYSHPAFLNVFTKQIKKYNPESFDHVLFSYHGLPLSHIKEIHNGKYEADCNCKIKLPDYGTFCYKAACYETTRLLAQRLNLNQESYSTTFQSRLSKNWLSPFTDATIVELANKKIRRLLIVAPAFVADCLETLVEIKEEYGELFKKSGGEELVLVESLNDSDEWADVIIEIVDDRQ